MAPSDPPPTSSPATATSPPRPPNRLLLGIAAVAAVPCAAVCVWTPFLLNTVQVAPTEAVLAPALGMLGFNHSLDWLLDVGILGGLLLLSPVMVSAAVRPLGNGLRDSMPWKAILLTGAAWGFYGSASFLTT